MSGASMNSNLLSLHFWITVLRLLSVVFGIAATGVAIGQYDGYVSYDQKIVLSASPLVFFNDLFILTVDFRRTNTYIGLVLVQGILSLTIVIMVAIFLKTLIAWGTYWIAVYTPVMLCALCSVLLLALTSSALWSIRSTAPPRVMWAINVKDATLGLVSPAKRPNLTWKGHARGKPWARDLQNMSLVNRITRMLLRRVSPVETKLYALFRNVFALLSIIVIIWRTITSLLQAQNKFETRELSDKCPTVSNTSDIQILMFMNRDTRRAETLNISVTSTVLGVVESPCEPSDIPLEGMRIWNGTGFSSAGFTSFNCNYSDPSFVFNIQTQSTGEALFWDNLPYIWISSKVDSFYGTNGWKKGQTIETLTPWFAPAWQLQPGFHVEANAEIIIRRFITSSIFNDVVLQRKATFKEILMFPISTTRITSLNNNKVATASITIHSQQKYSMFNSRQNSYYNPPIYKCDYIQDYRSSTVFDVIGSVGGLFALLQSLHVVLFGRPMLWGLTGAKLITPFGLLGGCSRRRFRRRLREHYHYPNPHSEDVAEAIRIGTFLRDFVIDFGPADVENLPLQAATEQELPSTVEPTLPNKEETLLLSPPEDYRLSLDDGPLETDEDSLMSDELNVKA